MLTDFRPAYYSYRFRLFPSQRTFFDRNLGNRENRKRHFSFDQNADENDTFDVHDTHYTQSYFHIRLLMHGLVNVYFNGM